MTVLLVGADRLGNIPKELEEFGYDQIVQLYNNLTRVGETR